MSDGVTASISGLDVLLKEMAELPAQMQKRVLTGAMGKACSVFRQEAIRLAPEWTGTVAAGHPPPGTLKKAIYQVRLADKCTSTTEAWKVGVRKGKAAQATKRGKGSVNLDAFYASWVEFGHYTRAPKSAGATAKARRTAVSQGAALVVGAHFVLPQPFMRPAFETKKTQAIEAFRKYMVENIPLAVQAMTIIKASK